MRLGSPLEAISESLASACYKDLDDIHYETKDYTNWKKDAPAPTIAAVRRPTSYDVQVYAMFGQTWSSTALGFGGMGGAAMTPAYTTIINRNREFAVYFAGRFAYKVNNPNVFFFEDIKSRNMHKVAGALERYAGDSTNGVVHEGPDI